MAKMTYRPMDYYLALPWSYEVSPADDTLEPWTARVKELPGCMAHGKTPAEAVGTIGEAIESYVLATMKTGDVIPEPISLDKFKGSITIRTTPQNHYLIYKQAQSHRMSLNRFIEQTLEEKLGIA